MARSSVPSVTQGRWKMHADRRGDSKAICHPGQKCGRWQRRLESAKERGDAGCVVMRTLRAWGSLLLDGSFWCNICSAYCGVIGVETWLACGRSWYYCDIRDNLVTSPPDQTGQHPPFQQPEIGQNSVNIEYFECSLLDTSWL